MSGNVSHGQSPSQFGRRPATHVKIVPPKENPDAGKDVVVQAQFVGDICGECWPDGWPEDHTDAGCIHGNWSRIMALEVGETRIIGTTALESGQQDEGNEEIEL